MESAGGASSGTLGQWGARGISVERKVNECIFRTFPHPPSFSPQFEQILKEVIGLFEDELQFSKGVFMMVSVV